MHLEGVLGQERARAQLEAEAKAGRLAHAYLFVGPKGTGRGTTALALFKALNCQDESTEAPCGVCPSCRRVQAGQHEDLLVLAPAHGQASAQIKVEEVREMLRALSFPPFGGGWRLVLIREAGQLNPTSANVLLKTLEEPPPRNILVLSVQDAGEVLPTLVSRCRRLNFQPLPEALVQQELQSRGLDPDEAALRAALSAGSLGRALGLDHKRLRQNLEHLLEQIDSGRGSLEDWAFAEEVIAPFKGPERLDRQGLAEFLDLLGHYYRDQAARAAGRPQAALLPVLGAGQPVSLGRALSYFSLLRQAQGLILSNAAPELTLTVLLGRLRQARVEAS